MAFCSNLIVRYDLKKVTLNHFKTENHYLSLDLESIHSFIHQEFKTTIANFVITLEFEAFKINSSKFYSSMSALLSLFSCAKIISLAVIQKHFHFLFNLFSI